MDYCKEYETRIDDTHAKYYTVKDQTSCVWRKKIRTLEQAEPQAPDYTLISSARYLSALDALYTN
jgi:hypothetical protein